MTKKKRRRTENTPIKPIVTTKRPCCQSGIVRKLSAEKPPDSSMFVVNIFNTSIYAAVLMSISISAMTKPPATIDPSCPDALALIDCMSMKLVGSSFVAIR